MALVKLLSELSRRKIRSVIDSGGCYINGSRARMSSLKVSAGQKVELQLASRISLEKVVLKRDALVHQEKRFVLINKPPGLHSQATKNQKQSHLIPCTKELLVSLNLKPCQLSLVHRLDAETTGLIIIAKSGSFGEFMQNMFRERKIQKTYHVLGFGRLAKPKITVENYLSKMDLQKGKVYVTNKGKGKYALTSFRELNYFEKYNISLIEAKPKTGRTHQIRVHLASLKCPVLGDKRYLTTKPPSLSKKLDVALQEHHMLHAQSLEWIDDLSKKVSFSGAYPNNFSKILAHLESSIK